MSKAQEIGRFIYIEPNDLYLNKPSNAIPQPYEDYSMAVDLQVEIPSRDSCGDPSFKKTLYFSSDNGTISFFGGSGGGDGKQGYLTTNFTDISPMNVGKGNKETLGISSINVTYNSWYYPTVTINFVDVRGTSLMMPQEYAYRTEVSNNTRDITQIEGGSFFKALFSFPYPMFKLTIKGFYGRAVSYKLAVSDFRATFNSQSGNFECVAKFIGYMYGVYTDIPMTYLSVAPYIGREGNSKYGQSWLESDFYFHSEVNGEEVKSAKMKTYPEFALALYSASTQLDRIVASTKTALDMNEVRKKKSALKNIKDTFINLKFIKIKEDKFSGKNLYYLITKQESDYDLAERIITLKKLVTGFCDANYSENDSGSLLKTLDPLFKLVKEDGDKRFVKSSSKNKVLIDDGLVNGEFRNKLDSTNRASFDNDVKSFSVNNNTKAMYVVSFNLITDFVEYLNGQDKQYEKKCQQFEIHLQQERLKALEGVLGFYPSIKNIFDMTFAHMETFVKEYYKMLSNVRDDMQAEKRKPESFGIYDETQTDFKLTKLEEVSNEASNPSKQVPPFPLFVKETIQDDGSKINRVVGPWDFDDENMKMPEMQFVIKLLNAGKYYSDETKKVNEAISQAKEAQGSILPDVDNLVPTTLYDFANPSFNPYQSVPSAGSRDTDKTYQIILTFFLRWYYFATTFGSRTNTGRLWFNFDASDDLTNYFAQMEAFNLKKVLPKITDSIRNSLLVPGAYNRILKTLFEENNPLWDIKGNSKLLMTDGDKVIYNWLEDESGKKVLPIGEFGVNAIKTDLANGNYGNSNKYAILSNDCKMFDLGANKTNFVIEPNGNLFEDTITAIKNADDGVGNVKDDFIESIEEQSIFTKSKSNQKDEPYINDGKIFITEEVPISAFNKQRVQIGANSMDKTYEDALKILLGINAKKYTLREIEEKNFTEEEKERLRSIGDGTAINGDFAKHVFANDVFKAQTDILSKAYLFVLSLPLRTSIFKEGKHMIHNGTTLKSMLLREGAYYWRYNEMRPDISTSKPDPITLPDGYVGPDENYVYITKEDSTLNFVTRSETDKSEYIKFGTSYPTQGRKNTVRKYFENWASSIFPKILHEVEKRPNDYFLYDEYNKLILDTLAHFESVVDETPQIASKENNVLSVKELYKPRRRNFEAALKKFIDKLKTLYNEKDDVTVLTTETNLADSTDIVNDKDLMLSTYLVLKSLYDKWFCGMDKETWSLKSDKSDFKNFKYLDNYYNDIGHKLIPNVNTTLELVKSYMSNEPNVSELYESPEYQTKSVLEFLSENCQKIGVWLQTLPLMYGLDPTDKEKIEDMFDAIPFTKYTNGKGLAEGETYLCMYTYKPSEHLGVRDDSGQYDYTDDSFDICDINGKYSNVLPVSLNEVGKNTIPAFGVTYAKQNQTYFKNISVSMDNPMQTEASLLTTLYLASKAGDEPRTMVLDGQDLYRVYSNHSYTCTVEMMGDMQITPMMYFQLNNIPMFRGAYMIIKVEHNVVAGNITTKFTGVRQNKNALPLVVGAAILFDSEGNAPVAEEQLTEGKPSSVGYDNGVSTQYVRYSGEKTAMEVNKNYVRQAGVFNCDEAIKGMYMSKTTTYGSTTSIIAINNTKSHSNCPGFVRRYMEDGGIDTNDRPGTTIGIQNGFAKDWASEYIMWLPTKGFKCIGVIPGSSLTGNTVYKKRIEALEKCREICERGDICVMNHVNSQGKNWGHICMWNDIFEYNDGKKGVWVSDFRQDNGPWPYSSQNPYDLYIFRFCPEVVRGDMGNAKRIITPWFNPKK